MLTVPAALTVVLAAWLCHRLDARPDGAPPDACKTMDPGESHGGVPQSTPCPYRLFLNKYDMEEDEKALFTIEAPPGRKIRGFMIQARNFDQKPIGEFIVAATDIKAINCGSKGIRNAATHKSTCPKDRVQVVWQPPKGYCGTVTFFATIAENRTVYWVREAAEKVLSISSQRAD